jgi:hypothetical protein
MKFVDLDKGIQDWLGSSLVMTIVVELNEKIDALGPEVKVIPGAIRSLVLKNIEPEQFLLELKKGLPDVANAALVEIANSVKNRILKPVGSSLSGLYGINIAKIPDSMPVQPSQPVARTTPLAAPMPVKPAAPAVQARPTTITPTAPPPPPIRARVMEMAQVVDLRKPARLDPAKPAASTATSAPAVRAAQTMKIEGTFGAGNQQAATGSNAMNTNQPTNSVATKKPEGESEVLDAKKEFGLAEVIPKPPDPQEIEVYQDEHPVVDKSVD